MQIFSTYWLLIYDAIHLVGPNPLKLCTTFLLFQKIFREYILDDVTYKGAISLLVNCERWNQNLKIHFLIVIEQVIFSQNKLSWTTTRLQICCDDVIKLTRMNADPLNMYACSFPKDEPLWNTTRLMFPKILLIPYLNFTILF